MRYTIIGCGSIGRRHLANLISLGVPVDEIQACDEDVTSLVELGVQTVHPDALGDALSMGDAVLVCTPHSTHVPYAIRALRQGCHVFIEKPLSHTLDDALMLKAHVWEGAVVQVGFNLRFHPAVRWVKGLLEAGDVGNVCSAMFKYGSYLPSWRSKGDYRRGYAASSIDGGIVLDDIHEVDLLLHLLGKPEDVKMYTAKLSDLQIEKEDVAHATFRMRTGALVSLTMNYVQAVPERGFMIVGSRGTLSSDLLTSIAYHYDSSDYPTLRSKSSGSALLFDANQMYVDELQSFMTSIAERQPAAVTLDDGLQAQEVVERMLISARV